MELFPKNFNAGHWRTLQAICALSYAHALRFAIGLHGAYKFHLIVKYKQYQISSGVRAVNVRIHTFLVCQLSAEFHYVYERYNIELKLFRH